LLLSLYRISLMLRRMTGPTQRVLRALLERADDEQYGMEIADRAELAPGTTYPILMRLKQDGWVESRWEDIDPEVVRRPARHYFRLTSLGATSAREVLQRSDESAQVRARRRRQRATGARPGEAQ
jgi:PadR family transcriptional regulator, regulatory protein PadR